ncbi:MAG: hypothetical protein KDB23_10140, partial [Planctomycetales bacterium]|nr:hypothetical protein [Planctomycetales bacterium]
MSDTFKRLCWRELRAARSFTFALMLLAVALQTGLAAMSATWRWPDFGVHIAFIALSIPLVHLLALTATAFNREDDSGTIDWLRGLPSRLPDIWLAKVAVPWIASVGMLGALLLHSRYLQGNWDGEIAVLSGRSLEPDWWRGVLIACAFALVGSAVSQVIRRPLTAVVAAGIVLFMTLGVTGAVSVTGLSRTTLLTVIALATLTNWLAAPRWFQVPQSRLRRSTALSLAKRSVVRSAMGNTNLWRLGRRLLWTSRYSLLVSTTLLLLACVHVRIFGLRGYQFWTLEAILASSAMFLIVPVWFGGTLFHDEMSSQRGKLLLDHGVDPRLVFWVRLAFALVGGVAFVVAILANGEYFYGPATVHLVAYGALVVAAGSLVSLSIRSPLLAVTATALCAAMIGPLCLIAGWLNLPVRYASFFTIVILAAARLRITDGLEGRKGLKRWIPAIAVLSLGSIACWWGVYAYRVDVPGAYEGRLMFHVSNASFDDEAAQIMNHAIESVSIEPREAISAARLRAANVNGDSDDLWIRMAIPKAWRQQESYAEHSWWSNNKELLTADLEELLSDETRSHCTLLSLGERLNKKLRTFPQPQARFKALLELLLTKARHQCEREPHNAWLTYQLAMRFAHLPYFGGSTLDRHLAQDLELRVLDEMAFWAADERVSPLEITSAVKALDAEFERLPSLIQAVEIDALVDLAVLGQMSKHGASVGDTVLNSMIRMCLPGEVVRARKQLTTLYHNAIYGPQGLAYSQRTGYQFTLPVSVSKAVDDAIATTPSLERAYGIRGIGALAQVEREHLTRRSAQLFRLELIAARHQQGSLPVDEIFDGTPGHLSVRGRMPRYGVSFALTRECPISVMAALGDKVVDLRGATVIHDGTLTPEYSGVILALPEMDPSDRTDQTDPTNDQTDPSDGTDLTDPTNDQTDPSDRTVLTDPSDDPTD